MIWLHDPATSYTLHTEYYDGAGSLVGLPVQTTIPGNDKVLRIRLKGSVDPLVRSAKLRVTVGATSVSKTLTVRYRG